MNTLPRPYQLLENIVATINLVAEGKVSALSAPTVLEAAREFAQELAAELWRAGQTERRAMDIHEYDPPLWCGGMFLEEVTAAVGVPTVAPSDPARDMGRGRTIR